MDTTDAVAGQRQRVVGVADLIHVPLRRWRLVLAAAVVVTGALAGYLYAVPADYTATAVVVLRPVVTDPFTYPAGGADRAVNMNAENGIAASNEVIDAIAAVTGLRPPAVREALTIEVPTGGQVLRFRFEGDGDGQAVTGANTAADTYLRVRELLHEQQRAELLRSYDSTLGAVAAARTKAQKSLPKQTAPGSPAVQAVLDQVRAMNDQLAQLSQQRAKIASADLSPGVVSSYARAPVPSSHDRARLLLVAAVLAGLLLGAVLAHLVEAIDRRVRSAAQVAESTGLPVLGDVRLPARRGAAVAPVEAAYVAMAVGRWLDGRPGAPVVVLSARDDEGRAVVAGGLAAGLAEAGRLVYLGGDPSQRDRLYRVLLAAARRWPPVPASVGAGRVVPRQAEPPGPALPEGAPSPALAGTVPPSAGGSSPVDGAAAWADPDTTVRMVAWPGEVWSPSGVQWPAGGPGPAHGPVPGPDSDDEPSGPTVVPVGAGSVRLGYPATSQDGPAVVVIDGPATRHDHVGVRLAQAGGAVLVAARDRTRQAELCRLVDQVRAAGAEVIGVVLTGSRRG